MRYPIIVEQVWHVLDHLAEDLQIWPCRYDTEADIQAEFVRRLVNALEATGFDTFQGQVVDASGGEPEISTFSRVGCQHGVRDREHGGITHPDVVLYDDLPDPTDWPKDAWMWPILMAIEFKYGYTTSRDAPDVRKLARLIKTGAARYGCWINVCRSPDVDTHGILYDSLGAHHGLQSKARLWSAHIVAPSRS